MKKIEKIEINKQIELTIEKNSKSELTFKILKKEKGRIKVRHLLFYIYKTKLLDFTVMYLPDSMNLRNLSVDCRDTELSEVNLNQRMLNLNKFFNFRRDY